MSLGDTYGPVATGERSTADKRSEGDAESAHNIEMHVKAATDSKAVADPANIDRISS